MFTLMGGLGCLFVGFAGFSWFDVIVGLVFICCCLLDWLVVF